MENDFFEVEAKRYSDRYEKFTWNLYEKIYQRRRINAILSYNEIYSKKNILDAGCGSGDLLKAFTLKFKDDIPSLTGFDLSANLINIAKSKNILNCTFFQADILEQNIKADQYDLIFCIGVIPYISDIKYAMSELNKIAKKNSICLLTYPYSNPIVYFLRETKVGLFIRKNILKMAYYQVKYSLEEFKDICIESGFKIEDEKKLPFSEYLYKLRK